MAKQVRIGIIGAGGIFRSRHLPGLAKIDEAEVAAICNRSEDSGRKIADEFGLKPDIMTDPDALLARDDIDAVMIGTWPYMHCPFVLASLEAGKHTFVQARMAMNLREAKTMYARGKESGLVTQICPSPMAMKGDWFVQRLVREGYLGTVYNVYSRSLNGGNCDPAEPLHWRQIDRYSGLNALNVGILVEVIHRWVGCLKTVTAQAATSIDERPLAEGESGRVERPDTVNVMGEMENGAQAAFLFSSVARFGSDSRVEMYGSEGTLVYDLDNDRVLGGKAGGSGLEELTIPEGEERTWTVEQDFVDAVNGGPQGDTSFEAGVRYMEFTEAAFRSVERGETVRLPLVD